MFASKLIRRLVLGLMLSLTAGQALAYCFSCELPVDSARDSVHTQHAGHSMESDETDSGDSCCDSQQCGAGNCFVYVPLQFSSESEHVAGLAGQLVLHLRAPPVSPHFKPPIYS